MVGGRPPPPLSISHTYLLFDRVSRTETRKSAFRILKFGWNSLSMPRSMVDENIPPTDGTLAGKFDVERLGPPYP